MDHKTTFPLRNGSTRNVADDPTKVIGHTVAIFPTLTRKSCASKLEKKVLSAVQHTDDRLIHGCGRTILLPPFTWLKWYLTTPSLRSKVKSQNLSNTASQMLHTSHSFSSESSEPTFPIYGHNLITDCLSDPLRNNIPSDMLEAAKKSTSEIVSVSKDAFKSKS